MIFVLIFIELLMAIVSAMVVTIFTVRLATGARVLVVPIILWVAALASSVTLLIPSISRVYG